MSRMFCAVLLCVLFFRAVVQAEQVGLIAPLTGPVSYMGREALNGAQLALQKTANVTLAVEDSAYQPAQGVSAFQKLSSQGVRYFIVVGSPIVLAVKPISESSGVFVLASIAAHPKILEGSRLMIRHSGRMDTQARALAPELDRLAHPAKLVAISAEADWTGEFTNELRRVVAQKRNLSLSEYTHLPTETDFRSIITKGRTEQPALWIVNSFGVNAATIVRQIRQLGSSAPIIAASGLAISPDALALVKDARVPDVHYLTPNDPPERFASMYSSRYTEAPHFMSFWAYQDVELIGRLIERKEAAIADRVSALKREGYIESEFGRMEIAPDGDIVEPPRLRSLSGDR